MVNYSYDGSRRVTSVQAPVGSNTYKNEYAYTNDRLTQVKHNTSTTTSDVVYNFAYDALGRPTTVHVGSALLSQNNYDNDRFGKLRSVRYGNNQGVEKVYDEYGREIGTKVVTFSGDTATNVDSYTRYEYRYSTNGQIGLVRDNKLSREAWNEYDHANRPIKLTEVQKTTADPNVLIHRTSLTYDTAEHVASFKEEIANATGGNGEYSTTYLYNYDDQMTRGDVRERQQPHHLYL